MKIKKRALSTILAIFFIFLIAYFIFLKYKTILPAISTTEMSLNPIQCLGNAWEFDWLKKHPGKYHEYPRSSVDSLNAQEKAIIKDFYTSKGIEIFDIQSKSFYELGLDNIVCAECSCPTGYTIYIKTNPKSVEILKQMGWKK